MIISAHRLEERLQQLVIGREAGGNVPARAWRAFPQCNARELPPGRVIVHVSTRSNGVQGSAKDRCRQHATGARLFCCKYAKARLQTPIAATRSPESAAAAAGVKCVSLQPTC